MATQRANLLEDDVLGVRTGAARLRGVSLPTLLSAMARSEDVEFTALRPHQRHAWHAFLVQLGALVMARLEARDMPTQETAWQEGLRDLAGGTSDPWSLLVEDLSRPAFLQPPVPEGTLAGFKNQTAFPDEIDVLVTAKNHDVKSRRIRRPRPEHWVYALVTLQTMQGFSGKMSYGIARMNKGHGNRPGIGFSPTEDHAPRFRRDVAAWLDARAALIDHYGYDPRGLALLWLEPWDGDAALALQALDPFFVEICRRVRLVAGAGPSLLARSAPSRCARIAADEARGCTGDVWTPVHREGKALTLDASGFSYKKTQAILLGRDYEPGAAMRLRPEDGPEPLFLATALVRGQGKTEGLKSRTLRVPPRVASLLLEPGGRELLAKRSSTWLDIAGDIQGKVLRPAVAALLQGGPEKLDLKDPRIGRWTTSLDARIDDVFYETLWTSVDEAPEEADLAWTTLVLGLAQDELEDAIRSAPMPVARRYPTIASAEGRFHGAARKRFPEALSRLRRPAHARA
jgi:CRISPR system Cascade subunit CasA